MNMTFVETVGRVSYGQFTPTELFATTGLGVDMQRVWRKRGHLPPITGRIATFSTLELMKIAIMYELSGLGVSPRNSESSAELGASTVLFFSVLNGKGAVDVRGSIEEVTALARRMEMMDRVALSISGSEGKGRFLWSSAPPNFELIGDIEKQIEEAGVIGQIVIDLMWLGIKLAERTPKPFVTIEAA